MKLPWEKLDAWAAFGPYLVSPAVYPGFSDLWGSPPTSSELYPDTRLFFYECLGIQFFNSLTCDLQNAMPCQRSLALFPREAEDFPGGDNHSGHMPLLIYLVWLQPLYYNPRFVFICVNTEKGLLVVKTLIKNIEQQPH